MPPITPSRIPPSAGVEPVIGERPALFVRMRLFRGGQAEWLLDLVRDEQANLYDDLGRARADGKPEDSEEVQELREKILWTINTCKDIESSLIELVGPNRDPR